MIYNLNPTGDSNRPEEGIYFFTGEKWRIIPGTAAHPVTFSVVSDYKDTTTWLKTTPYGELKVEVKANAPVSLKDVKYMWILSDRNGQEKTIITVETAKPVLTIVNGTTIVDAATQIKPGVYYDVFLTAFVKNQSRRLPSFVTTLYCNP
jgi:hypothetical protein